MTSEQQVEYELKLRPDEAELLDRLFQLDSVGPFQVIGRRRERQRNSFFDSRTRALGGARLALRRRTVPGQAMATWTLKAEGELLRGIASRPEVEVHLGPDMPPAMALATLTQAAKQRGAAPLAEQVADAIVGMPQLFLELDTDRRILDLRSPDGRTELELALDEVQLVGHPPHKEHEIEVELRRGDTDALEQARCAIEALGSVQSADGSKLSRAVGHIEACDCTAR
jgi:inorganic triphosphatase YgiF